MTGVIFHIVPVADWEDALETGVYRPASLESEGFIHFSRADQVVRTASALFAGRTDLRLLVVQPWRVPAGVVWEDSYGHGSLFPHLYGALPTHLVSEARPFLPDEAGQFHAPDVA